MASGDEKKEIPIGEINGINSTFFTSLPYESDSLYVFVGGIIYGKSFVVEISSTEFQTTTPPRSKEDLTVRYIEQ